MRASAILRHSEGYIVRSAAVYIVRLNAVYYTATPIDLQVQKAFFMIFPPPAGNFPCIFRKLRYNRHICCYEEDKI